MTSLASLPASSANVEPPVGAPSGGEFVDLYALLGAAPDAPVDQLRARIGALYLEAQHNLDHHNFRKRFYYQQLFEVHLPQAYDCLLDAQRRAYYDTCLSASRKGEPFPPSPSISTPQSDTSLPTVSDAPVTESLPFTETASGVERATPETGVPAALSAAPSDVPLADAIKLSSPTAHDKEAPLDLSETEIEVERRRDHKRRELIKSEVHTAAWAWGSVGGAAVVGASFILLALGVPLMQRTLAPAGVGGPSPVVLWVLGLWLSAMVAGAAFIATSRVVRRIVINKLSQMPYEELLRRCAQ